MTTATAITTAEQLLRAGDIGRCELVRGELHMMSPAGFRHTIIALRIGRLIGEHVERNRLGAVSGADGGYVLERSPDTVRAPDAGFVRAERLQGGLPLAFFEGAPDRAVEVLSPGDTASEVLARTSEYLDRGTREVWIVDPERETVTVHRSNAPMRTLTRRDTLTCDDLLPGLRLVQSIFE